MVVRVEEKAHQMCQVPIKETSESEPLVKCRKRSDNVKTEG